MSGMTENLPVGLTESMLAQMEASGPTDDFGARDLMIPSLRILQANSRETKRSTAEYVDGAREGMFYINVSRQMFDTLSVIPVKYMHVVREFESGDLNARMVADHGTNLDVLEGLQRDDRGRYKVPNSARVMVESALYFLLALTPTGVVPCAMRLGSTQWRKARRCNTEMQNFEITRPDGSTFKPPMFARSYILSARPEQNEENSWFGYHIENGPMVMTMVGGPDLFARALRFREAAQSESARVVEDAPAASSAADDGAEIDRRNGAGAGSTSGKIDDEIPFAAEWR